MVVRKFLELKGVDTVKAYGPTGMGQYVVFGGVRVGRGEGGRM